MTVGTALALIPAAKAGSAVDFAIRSTDSVISMELGIGAPVWM